MNEFVFLFVGNFHRTGICPRPIRSQYVSTRMQSSWARPRANTGIRTCLSPQPRYLFFQQILLLNFPTTFFETRGDPSQNKLLEVRTETLDSTSTYTYTHTHNTHTHTHTHTHTYTFTKGHTNCCSEPYAIHIRTVLNGLYDKQFLMSTSAGPSPMRPNYVQYQVLSEEAVVKPSIDYHTTNCREEVREVRAVPTDYPMPSEQKNIHDCCHIHLGSKKAWRLPLLIRSGKQAPQRIQDGLV